MVVDADGHRTLTQTVVVRTGQPLRLSYKLQPLPARLVVSSDNGGWAYLNGKRVGRGGFSRTVAPGIHRVKVVRGGYKTYGVSVRLAPGERREVRAQLIPQLAVINVSSVPKDSSVHLNGRDAGYTPETLRVRHGTHTITVHRDGYKTLTQTVVVRTGQPLRLSYKLQPLPARLVVSSDNGGWAYLNGKRVGRGGFSRTVAPGIHRVKVVRGGYKTYGVSVRLAPGERREVRAQLIPQLAVINVSSVPKDSSVHLNGRDAGYTPETLRVRHGTHTITVHRDGYKWWERSVRVRPGQTRNLRVTLQRQKAQRPRGRLAGSGARIRHRPLAVMIENHPNARPQSGLDYADVVLEAPAEFGISRFVAFFITRDAPVVGPVRSARKYFVLWAREFNPIYFHAGYSPGAPAVADRIKLTRTNALRDSRAFYRTSDRVAPHNLYTSTSALLRAERAKGRGLRSGSWGGLRFKQPGTLLGPRRVTSARLIFNDYYYVDWRWDPSRGVYRRWMQGSPAIERNTGAQITATAVIVRVHEVYRIAGDDKAREEVQVYGSGKAYVLQDGRMTPATWRKPDAYSPTLYYDEQGNRIAVNKGGVWIQVIPQYGGVRFE